MSRQRAATDRRGFLKRLGGAGVAALLSLRSQPAHASYDGGEVISAVTFIHGIPGRERDLEQHLLSLSPATRAEPGCIAYDLYRSAETPSDFLRIEQWKSRADLEAHKQMPHLRASFEKRQREGWTTQITVWKRVAQDLT